jgi:hypothetical protein
MVMAMANQVIQQASFGTQVDFKGGGGAGRAQPEHRAAGGGAAMSPPQATTNRSQNLTLALLLFNGIRGTGASQRRKGAGNFFTETIQARA